MQAPITLMFTSVFALFGLFLSFRAGTFRGKAGASLLYGDPPNMELVARVRAHQNFLEYVPMILIVMALVEINGGSAKALYGVGGLLLVCRIAHAVGLKHDNMAHPGRFIGAAGTALLTLLLSGYGLFLAWI